MTITAAPIASTTTLTAAPTTATVNTAVVFTASVAPATGSNVPTGTVTFKDGTTMLGTATLASGKASYTNSALTAGAHSITASYAGDAGDNASTSSAVTVTITAAAPAAPTGVTAVAVNAQITLSWTASSGATSYSVYQGTAQSVPRIHFETVLSQIQVVQVVAADPLQHVPRCRRNCASAC